MNIKTGDMVKTPRFLTVRIAAVFDTVATAIDAGYTEPTHYRDEDAHILGKHTGTNLMIFCAVPRA